MPATTRETEPKRVQFKPKEPLPVQQRLPKLYRGLVDQVEGSHFAGAIKTCRKSESTSIPGASLMLISSPFSRPRICLGVPDSVVPTSTYRRLHLGPNRSRFLIPCFFARFREVVLLVSTTSGEGGFGGIEEIKWRWQEGEALESSDCMSYSRSRTDDRNTVWASMKVLRICTMVY